MFSLIGIARITVKTGKKTKNWTGKSGEKKHILSLRSGKARKIILSPKIY